MDAQATGEAFSPQKITSSTYRIQQLKLMRIHADPDPDTGPDTGPDPKPRLYLWI